MIRFAAEASASVGTRHAERPRGRGLGWKEVGYLRLPAGRLVPLSAEDYLNLARRNAEALPRGATAWLTDQPWSVRARIEAAVLGQRGAISFTGGGTQYQGAFPTSVTLSFDCSGGDALFCAGFQNTNSGAASVNSATYNSVSMTSDASLNGSTGNARGFYLAAPAGGGAHNLVVNVTTGSAASASLTALAYSGVDQTTVITAAGTTGTNTNTNASFTQTTASGDMVVAAFCISTGGFHTVTAGTGTTLKVNQSATQHRVGMEEAGTGASQTINATWTTSDTWWGVSASLKAAAAGGAGLATRRALLGVGL